MKRSFFKKKIGKPMKRTPLAKVSNRKPKLTSRQKKMSLKRELIAQYELPSVPCARYGTGKAPTRQDILKGMLWYVFSRWVRQRDKGACITHGPTDEELQAGHYAPAGGNDLELLFSEVNVNGECAPCNADFQQNGWHLVKMRRNLIIKYGLEKVEEIETLETQKRAIKWEEVEYVQRIKYYYENISKMPILQ